ncbi:cytochrome c biogenesis protein CcdC [Oceanobacillus piezotolerans]|uniref:Cytochrome c biogenesis protein CcdC n=1 Tax=Oceanobacillus piezotolerans TaxID=2448030 RepID=A0A498D9C6_9BACI|nr:cytochrome c biogenesis protein CcdC [Oceanobacillus piezotolerans]RLL45417.1 cytochrome c biogenesis protein CcdC [Oceanobacillus piezotolerans]
MFYLIASSVVFACMAIGMIFIRMRAASKPASIKKIVLPPIMMSTGAFMFVFPVFQIGWVQVLEAFLVGVVFSVFLIKTSKFEKRGEDIFLKPSKAFPIILLSLLVIRIIIKLIIGSHISLGETTGMFFILALGMIVSWRIAMLYKFLNLRNTV